MGTGAELDGDAKETELKPPKPPWPTPTTLPTITTAPEGNCRWGVRIGTKTAAQIRLLYTLIRIEVDRKKRRKHRR